MHQPKASRSRPEHGSASADSSGAGDGALVAFLATVGFRGPDYEAFERRLVEVSLPTLEAMIRSGQAFAKLDRLGRPRRPTGSELELIRLDPQVARSLGDEAVVRALRRCRRPRDDGTWAGWRADGGSSLVTWFVNACLLELANAYETWRRSLPPPMESLERLLVPPSSASHADDVDLAISLARAIGELRPREREVLLRYHRDEWSHRTIAAALGTTEHNSQQLLSRARRRLRTLLSRQEGV